MRYSANSIDDYRSVSDRFFRECVKKIEWIWARAQAPEERGEEMDTEPSQGMFLTGGQANHRPARDMKQ